MTEPCDWDHESRCYQDNCTQPATHKRMVGITDDDVDGDGPGTAVMHMVCCRHAHKDPA